MDVNAVNFNAAASCDVQGCQYLLQGHVFDDLDEDGIWDTNEYAVAYRTVVVPFLGLTLITNDEGMFQTTVGVGGFTVSVADDLSLPYNTTPQSVQISFPEDAGQLIEFGLSKEMPLHAVCVDFYPNGGSFLCNDFANHNICYRNMGNVPIDGIVEVEYDGLFQGYNEVTPIDSTNGNILYMSFENLLPGEMFFYDVQLHTPTVDYIGDYVTSFARVYGYYEGDQVAYGEQELTMEITCAYDPNDKQVFPAGFTDDHLILNDTELEYLVRFQNTGNAVAQNVLLRDTLDANLDLSTFQLMANSHSVLTTVDANTREVTFLFQDILLPDSTCCEEDSHGLVSYIIRPYPELDAATEINNTAYIYFDNNPPIVTNTTWSTIHACSPGLELMDSVIEDCPGNVLEITSNYDQSIAWASTYAWTVEDEQIGSEASLVLSPSYEVEAALFLTISNPLCQEYGTEDFEFSAGFEWTSCVGDLDCDHAIGSTDVVLFLGEYGCSGVACRFDLNGDSIADSSDLLLVIGVFGTVCPD